MGDAGRAPGWPGRPRRHHPDRAAVLAEVKFFGRHKVGALRDGVLLSIEEMRRRASLRPDDVGTRPADDARQGGECRAAAHCLVPGLRTSGRAGPRSTSPTVRCGYTRPRLAGAARLLTVWEPTGRFGRQRDRASAALILCKTGAVTAGTIAMRRRSGWKVPASPASVARTSPRFPPM
jgi:hypothetical protein